MFALTWLAYFGFYLTRYSFSAAKSSLDLPDMDEATMGLIDSVYLVRPNPEINKRIAEP